MKLISDVINELGEIQQMYGDIEVIGLDGEDIALEPQEGEDGEYVVVVS